MTEFTDSPPLAALKRAIDVAEGQAKLAEALGIKQSAISNWIRRKKRAPAERVLSIERLTGVPRTELRPDLYPNEPARGRVRPFLEKRA